MSSKMKVASQHWTDWTDCDNVPNKTKDIFTLLRLKRFLYMIVGCSIPCRVVFAARCACRGLTSFADATRCRELGVTFFVPDPDYDLEE